MNEQIVRYVVGGLVAVGFIVYAFFAERKKKLVKELEHRVKMQRIDLDVLEHEIEIQRKYYDKAFEDFKNSHIPASMLDDIGADTTTKPPSSSGSGGDEPTH